MTKKDRNNIATVISGIFILVSLYLYWMVFNSSNIYIFFGIIFATYVVKELVFFLLPKKTSKQKNRGQKRRLNEKKKSTMTSPNRLRSDEEIIASTLEELSWREFERLCFLYYKARGNKPRETSEGADGGVDLIIYNRHDKADEAVQIKHYIHSGNQITVKEIRELDSAKKNHKCMLSKFITTSGYTLDALRQADDCKMKCHDHGWVVNHIVKWQKQEVQKKKLTS